MRFGLDISQHQLNWDELLDRTRLAEGWRFDSAWVFDHFQPLYGDPDGPCLEGWTLLAALAASTDRIRLGPLVTGITYRHPSLLATEVLTVDHVSKGRVNLGIGAAWHEPEHRQLGFDFPDSAERVSRLEEALQVFEALFSGKTVSFDGSYYQLDGAKLAPRPVQAPHPPFWIGAGGPRMMNIVARYADVWHSFGGPAELGPKSEQLSKLAEAAGRDPKEIERAGSLSLEQPFNEIRSEIAAWADLGFTHLHVGWPSQGEGLVERFAGEIMGEFQN